MVATTGLSFTRPEALLLLLVLLPLAVYLSRTSLALLRRGRRRYSLGLRLAIIALLVLALAGMEVVRASERLSVVFLLDRSDSVGQTGRALQEEYVANALEHLGPNDAAGVIAFGSDALVDRPVLADKTPPDLTSAPNTAYSNLGDAIKLGVAVAPADTQRRLVLLSDGRENAGSAEWAAKLSAANGVPVDVIELGSASGPEVWVNGLDAPETARVGERISLGIAVGSNTETTATLTVIADGTPLASEQVRLVRGENNFVQSLPALPRGFHYYAVEISPSAGSDTRRENNRHSAFTVVLGKPRVLVVEKQPGEGGPLQAALDSAVDVRLVSPEGMPADAPSLAAYDAVVLVNVPASELSTSAMDNLQLIVRDLGKGLIVIGGDESYAAGGYFRTPLQEMLPVDLNLPSKLDIPSVGMAMVIDRSGSMSMAHDAAGAGVIKIELAKEAANRAVAQLSERDYVGVITFDSAANWAVEMQPLGDPSMLRDRIGAITSGGGTNIYSGLAPAVDALIASKAKSKHIVLLTDGVSEGGDYDGLLQKMAANAITLSAVAVGVDADTTLMQYLAAQGKGRYYYTEDGNTLPEIFAHESHLASRSYIIEHAFSPERTSPSPLLDGIGALPTLQGYVGTSPRPAGQVVLVSDAGDPVLAQWQYGLGRVVAWTSDAKGQWAKEWVGWEGFPRFWAQAIRWSTGAEAGNLLQPRIELKAGTGQIAVDATAPDGSYLNDLDAQAVVVAPSLVSSTVTLQQTGAGRYEGTFPAMEEGAYLIRVSAQGSDVSATSQTLGVVVPYSPEYRGTDADTGLLPRLASLTGGRVLDRGATTAAFDRNLSSVRSTTALWPLLLLAAILLLPLDVGLRRVSIYRSDLARAARAVALRLRQNPVPAPAAAGARTPDMAALFTAKERTSERVSQPVFSTPRQATGQERLTQPTAHAAQTTHGAQDLQLSGREEHAALQQERGSAAPEEGRAAEEPGTLAARLKKAREGRN